MAWGWIKAILGKGENSGIGGAAQGIGKAVASTAKVWKVGADANDQRVFDSFASARNYVPQGWLAKQIRPIITLTTLSTFIMLNITICMLVYLSIQRFMAIPDGNMEDLIKEIALIFTLLAAPGLLYYTFVGTIMTYWFGGQAQKYGIAHAQAQADAERAHTRANTAPAPDNAPDDGEAPTNRPKPAHSAEIEAFNKEARDDFFERQAKDR